MAGGAGSEIGTRGDTEIIQNIFLAQLLPGLRIEEIPGPVRRLVDLLGGLGMTGETGLGNLWSSHELFIKFLEFTMVRG